MMFTGNKGLFRKRPQSEDMSLQITSMADIFVILLVFLLKSYATGAVSLAPVKGMMLPQAFASEATIEALKVEISENSVAIEGQPVAELKAFRFQADALQPNGASTAVSKALNRERRKQLLIAQSNSDVKIDPRIMIISDQRAPYATVKSVLASAALNGYTDFKLAVVKGN